MIFSDDMSKVLKTRPELLNQLDAQETAIELSFISPLRKKAVCEIIVIHL